MTQDSPIQNKESGAAQQPVRAPRGTVLSCQGWPQEAALRLLMNSADLDLAEYPPGTIGGNAQTGARDGGSFNAIVAGLRKLNKDETLFVQSEVPVGVFRTGSSAPRVVLVREPLLNNALQFEGMRLFIGNAAASWLLVGCQGVLQSAYELLAAAARAHFDGTLAGRLVLAGSLGTVNGAHALAATMHGAAFLGIEVNPEQIKRRVKSGYCDVMVNDLDEALRILKNAVRRREAASVGLVGNAAAVIPELARRGVLPDIVCDDVCDDRIAAYDAPHHYVPRGLTVEQAAKLQFVNAGTYRRQALDSMAAQARGELELQSLGAVLLNCEGKDGLETGPIFGEDSEPLTWIALSGDPGDIVRVDHLLLDLFPSNQGLQRWIPLVQKHVRAQGLPARVVWLSRTERIQFAGAVNDLVARGEVSAPVVFGRVRGGMLKNSARDGSGPAPGLAAISRILAGPEPEHAMVGALLDAADGCSWATLELSSGDARAVQTIGSAIVADGTAEIAARIEGVLGRSLGDADSIL